MRQKDLRRYSVSLKRVAGIYEAKNDLEKALALYLEGLETDRQLEYKYPQDIAYLDGYAAAAYDAGNLSGGKQRKKLFSLAYKIAAKNPDLPKCSQILNLFSTK